MTLLFISCTSTYTDTAQVQEFPVEAITCAHPDSRYEGVVQVEIEDEFKWDYISFEISQDDYAWKTYLQTEDQLLWWTKMQLIELDCFRSFDYDVAYGVDDQ